MAPKFPVLVSHPFHSVCTIFPVSFSDLLAELTAENLDFPVFLCPVWVSQAYFGSGQTKKKYRKPRASAPTLGEMACFFVGHTVNIL